MPKNNDIATVDYFCHTYEQRVSRLVEFKSRNIETYSLATDLYILNKWLVEASLLCEFHHFIEKELIQKIDSFFHNAIILNMSEQPQLGLASARIAIESGRDLLRILESDHNRELFLCTDPSKEEIKQYRNVFRFQEHESHLLDIYHFASNYGVHSKIQVRDSVAKVQSLSGKNFKVSRQKKHSQETVRLLLAAQYLLTDLIWVRLESFRELSASPEMPIYVDLFKKQQVKIGPRLLEFPEFKKI